MTPSQKERLLQRYTDIVTDHPHFKNVRLRKLRDDIETAFPEDTDSKELILFIERSVDDE